MQQALAQQAAISPDEMRRMTNTRDGTSAREAQLRANHSQLALMEMLTAQAAPMMIPGDVLGAPASVKARNPEGTLALIKKSIKEIKAEAVGEKAQGKIQAKIDRLRSLGVEAQAVVLETELMVRVKLMRLGEWKYKVLPFDAIEEFVKEHRNWDGQGGYYKVHIEPVQDYCGLKDGDEKTEAKDKIIPEAVLGELETAQEREVFDKVSVLWVEKVKDPLLLGSINGCMDYFLIAEWGKDVSFDEIIQSSKTSVEPDKSG